MDERIRLKNAIFYCYHISHTRLSAPKIIQISNNGTSWGPNLLERYEHCNLEYM